MNRQRKIVITVTYNDLGVIVDTKAEELNSSAQPDLQPACNQLATDCISRQQAIDALDCINGVEEVLRSLPSAQPERAEGYWIRRDCCLDVECKCSACGYKDFVSPHDTYWFKRNYCPNCGAKMKGVKHETD